MADDQPHDDQPDPYLAEHAGEIADAIIVLQEALGRVDLLDDQDRRYLPLAPRRRDRRHRRHRVRPS
jgi:hypothetical protein